MNPGGRKVRGGVAGVWAICLLGVLPASAGADWVVLSTGERVETRGHWTLKGKQLVYTSLDKSLRSIRLSEVDLAASTRASTQEPPSEKKLYQDLGEAPDIVTYKPPKEFSRLNAWITNPNAPRASGTVSVPGLRISESDLAREGRRILADPGAVEDELLSAAAQIDGELDRCLERNADGGDAGQCVDVYAREAADLRQKAAEVYAAVNAARAVEAREQQLLAEDAAETQRIDNERAAEEREAQRAAAAAEAAENPPEPPQR